MASGADVLETVARGEVPDLMLLDIMMPDMDGYGDTPPARDSVDGRHPGDLPHRAQQRGGRAERAGPRRCRLHRQAHQPPVVLARVQNHLERSASARRLAALSRQLSRYLAPQVVQNPAGRHATG